MAFSVGHFFMFLSTSGFAGMAAISKVIGARATSNEKMFWRSVLSISFSFAEQKQKGAVSLRRPKCIWLLALRGLLGYVATVCYMESIARLPLVEAMLLGKIHPLAAAIFARVFLGEPLHALRIVAIVTSVLGVALIAVPSPDKLTFGNLSGVSLALLAGIGSGGAYCCVRAVDQTSESDKLWLLLSFPMVTLPFVLSDAWAGFAARGFDGVMLAWFLALGVATQVGQTFLSRGLARVSAASGTQVMFLGSVLGVFFGVLLGDDWPSKRVWLGGAVILAALQVGEMADGKRKTG